MRKNYSVPAGFIVLMAITFLCTSYLPSFQSPSSTELNPGQYEIVVKGHKPIYLKGAVDFDSQATVTDDGETYTKWNIRLRNLEGANRHFLDFYLANTLSSISLDKGAYYVTENIESFFGEFEGVFGIADIDQFGELLFFSRQGRITIYKAEKESLTGSIQLELRNASGKLISVEGDFSALRNSFISDRFAGR